MANKTITVDTDMESLIATGLSSGENITINSGATLTCTETPSVLIGSVTINQGELHIDGLNITSGNLINFIGEGGLISGANDQVITANGQGKLNITGAWFDIGTTNGTNSQVIDLSVSSGVGYWDKGGADFCVDVIPMIQVETGRRINYTSGSGIDPAIGDWVYLTSDRAVMGKIHSVGVGYIIVWMLSGSIADTNAIQIRSVVDNNGPDLQVSWTATANGADVLESGVYMEFGNARSNGSNYISAFGHGYGGLVFHHEFEVTTLTLGSNAGGGFVPPSGCNIRVPNVVVNTSSLTDEGAGTPYASGLAFGCATNTNEAEWYAIECSAGGEIAMSICNWGNAYACDTQASKYDVEYAGFTLNVGSNIAGGRTSFAHVTVCQATELNAVPSIYAFGNAQDCVNGVDISFCMFVNPRCARLTFGSFTSIGVDISDCIHTAAGQGANQSSNSNYPYYFGGVNGGSITNCMVFGNNNTEQDQPVRISTSSDITVDMMLISTTQDYTEQTQEKDAFNIAGSRNVIIRGVEFIGNGTPGNYIFTIQDQNGVKVRAIGMIDDKIDLGVDGELGVNLVGLCDNIDIARCWFNKSTTITEEFIVVATTCKNVLIQNCSNKYAAELQPSGGANTRFKGIHGGSGTPGGSTGWEDAYIGSYGNSFHDGFHSDTKGTIACIMITPSAIANETNIITGNPLFFKDGDLNMKNGDVIEFEMGYFARGHTGFPGTYTTSVGPSGWNANEWGSQVTLDFQWMLEGGSWNGTWLDVRTPANWTGISGTIEAGVKLKFRFTGTGTRNDMSMLLIDTNTTLADQAANFYPIDQDEYTFTLTGLKANSEIRVYEAGSIIDIFGVENSTTTFNETYVYPGADFNVDIVVHHLDYEYVRLENITLSNSNISIPIQQRSDRIYVNP